VENRFWPPFWKKIEQTSS